MLISKDMESVLTQISPVTYPSAFGSEVTTDIQIQIKIFPWEPGCGAQRAAGCVWHEPGTNGRFICGASKRRPVCELSQDGV